MSTSWQVSQATIKVLDEQFGPRVVAEALGIAYELRTPQKHPNTNLREICQHLADSTPVRSWRHKMGRDRHDKWIVKQGEE